MKTAGSVTLPALFFFSDMNVKYNNGKGSVFL